MKIISKIALCVVVVGAFLAWLFYPMWSYQFKNIFFNTELEEMGVFGDSFGALNTLFSGLAFSGIIVSIFLQSQDLKLNRAEIKLNREEIEQTRIEMKEQGEQFKLQTEAMQKQVFENTLFNMLSFFNSLSFKINGSARPFFRLSGSLMEHAAIYVSQSTEGGKDACEREIKIIYQKFMGEEYPTLGHYFRYLYQILKFVEHASLKDEDKIFYAGILRAQLSSHELLLVFVNCIGYQKSDKFKRLIEKYSMLEHIYDADLNSLLQQLNRYKVKVQADNPPGIMAVDRFQLPDLKGIYSNTSFGI
ncbi:putative phage abortive infection protein [Aeromonas rivipollensis]